MPSSANRQMSHKDRIVVVMGPTGAGKSTFIDHATGQDGTTVGHGWQSRTSEVRSVRVQHPSRNYPVVFVDTPGFDDTFKSDTEILTIVADWLVKAKNEKVNLATILYLHRISDNRMSGSAMKNLRLFSSLCGQKAIPNVVIVTTMWSKVTQEEGTMREEALKREVWKDLLADGCTVARFEDTYESAWKIVGSLVKMNQAGVLLPREIVDDRLRLNETQVGITLNKELEKLIKDRTNAARKLQKLAENQDSELVVQELNEIEVKIQQTAKQLQQMKIPFARRIRLFFKGRSN